MYAYIDDLPIEVYNHRTSTIVFIVMPVQKVGDLNGTKDPIQPKRQRS